MKKTIIIAMFICSLIAMFINCELSNIIDIKIAFMCYCINLYCAFTWFIRLTKTIKL